MYTGTEMCIKWISKAFLHLKRMFLLNLILVTKVTVIRSYRSVVLSFFYICLKKYILQKIYQGCDK